MSVKGQAENQAPTVPENLPGEGRAENSSSGMSLSNLTSHTVGEIRKVAKGDNSEFPINPKYVLSRDFALHYKLSYMLFLVTDTVFSKNNSLVIVS